MPRPREVVIDLSGLQKATPLRDWHEVSARIRKFTTEVVAPNAVEGADTSIVWTGLSSSISADRYLRLIGEFGVKSPFDHTLVHAIELSVGFVDHEWIASLIGGETRVGLRLILDLLAENAQEAISLMPMLRAMVGSAPVASMTLIISALSQVPDAIAILNSLASSGLKEVSFEVSLLHDRDIAQAYFEQLFRVTWNTFKMHGGPKPVQIVELVDRIIATRTWVNPNIIPGATLHFDPVESRMHTFGRHHLPGQITHACHDERLEASQKTINPAIAALIQDIDAGIGLCRTSCSYFDICQGGWPRAKWNECGTAKVAETVYCQCLLKAPANIAIEIIEESAATILEKMQR